jgi:pimeloyl-ACP methyl ester carboxylesterase
MKNIINFTEVGQGEPVILLHGYALDHTIWKPVSDILSKQSRVIMPDLRGHGKSICPSGVYSMTSMAEDITGLMDELHIEKAFVAGHSMGGYIALAMAEIAGDRMKGLALVASHAYADSPEKKQARLADIKKLDIDKPDLVLSGMAEKLSNHGQIIKYCKQIINNMSAQGIRGVLAGMAERPDRIHVMQMISVQKILIAGKDDQLISINTARNMASSIESLLFFEIENAGHMPMLESPVLTAEALLNFIK